jgi:hypothetical protein
VCESLVRNANTRVNNAYTEIGRTDVAIKDLRESILSARGEHIHDQQCIESYIVIHEMLHTLEASEERPVASPNDTELVLSRVKYELTAMKQENTELVDRKIAEFAESLAKTKEDLWINSVSLATRVLDAPVEEQPIVPEKNLQEAMDKKFEDLAAESEVKEPKPQLLVKPRPEDLEPAGDAFDHKPKLAEDEPVVRNVPTPEPVAEEQKGSELRKMRLSWHPLKLPLKSLRHTPKPTSRFLKSPSTIFQPMLQLASRSNSLMILIKIW